MPAATARGETEIACPKDVEATSFSFQFRGRMGLALSASSTGVARVRPKALKYFCTVGAPSSVKVG